MNNSLVMDLHCFSQLYMYLMCVYFNFRCDVSNEFLSTDSSSSLPGLWLELYQLRPHVFGGSCEVAYLGVGVQSKHLGGVGQGEGVNVL